MRINVYNYKRNCFEERKYEDDDWELVLNEVLLIGETFELPNWEDCYSLQEIVSEHWSGLDDDAYYSIILPDEFKPNTTYVSYMENYMTLEEWQGCIKEFKDYLKKVSLCPYCPH